MTEPATCRHYSCQCAAADRFAAMGLPEYAVQLHRDNEAVRCVRQPWTLTEQLADLERTDPAVRAAARRLDQVTSDIIVDAEIARAREL